MRENAQKLRFVRQAVQSHDRFWKNDPLDTDLVGAVDWCAARTPEQVGDIAWLSVVRLLMFLVSAHRAERSCSESHRRHGHAFSQRRTMLCVAVKSGSSSRRGVSFVACSRPTCLVFDLSSEVSASVNGPLMATLGESISFHDMDAVDQFRTGGPLVTSPWDVHAPSYGSTVYFAGGGPEVHWQRH